MHTLNAIEIHGEPDTVLARLFALVSDLEDWPRLLPHYRCLTVTEKTTTRKIASFGASRDGFPVKWRAEQELFPHEDRITFRHIGGVSKGMWVEWRLEKRPDGVRAVILHELTYPVPVLGPLFAEYVVGKLFVSPIANKTLRCFKALIEEEQSRSSGSARRGFSAR